MSDLADALLPGLLRASAALAVAALLVAACVGFLRVRAPRAERIAWLVVLLQGVVLAQVFIPLPGSFFSDSPSRVTDETVPHVVSIPDRSGHIVAPHRRAREIAPIPAPDAAKAIPATSPTRNAGASWSLDGVSWKTIALAVWAAGLAVVLGLWVVCYGLFVRRLGRGRDAAEEWEVELREVLRQAGIEARIRLVVSKELGPSLCRRPGGTVIVVPESLWGELNPAERVAVLRHEVEQFRRGDLWWALLARVLAGVHWFNPFAWWAAGRFEEQAEFACDRAAAGAESGRFAELLLRLGSGRSGTKTRTTIRTLGVQTMARGNLYRRIQRLATSRQRSARWRSATPLVATLLVMAAAAIRFTALPTFLAAEEEPSEPTAEPLPELAIARLGQTAFYSPGFATDLAFSPDGRLIALGEANTDATIHLYDVTTARQVAQLTTENPETWMVECIAFSSDGRQLACGTTNGYVAVWNRADGKEVFNEQLHDGNVNDVAYSPDGKLLVTAGADGGIFVRSASEPSHVIQELKPGDLEPKPQPGDAFAGAGPSGTGPGPLSLAFTPDGSELVVGYDTGKITIWDPRGGELLHSFFASKDGEALAEGFIGRERLHTVAVLPDGQRLMTAGFERVKRKTTDLEYGPTNVRLPRVRIWELDSGEFIKGLSKPDEYGFGRAALSPDGLRIAIGLVGQLVIRRIEDGKTLERISLPGQTPDHPVFSPDDKLVATWVSSTLALFNVRTGQRLYFDPQTSVMMTLDADWSPSGDCLVTGGWDGGVRVWNANTSELIWYQQFASVIEPYGDTPLPTFVAFSPDGTKVIAAGERDDREKYRAGTMVVFNAATGETLREVDIPRRVGQGILSHDGQTAVLVTRYDSRCVGVDIASGKILFQTPGGQNDNLADIEAMRFLPDSQSFRVATDDSKIVQFDAATGQRQMALSLDWRTPEQHAADKPKEADLWFAAFTADASILVASSLNVICRWDAETGELLGRTEFPHEHGLRVEVSPDGALLALSDRAWGDENGTDTIRLYNREGSQIGTLAPNGGRAFEMAFSPDASRLFTGLYRKAPLLWDVTKAGAHGGGK